VQAARLTFKKISEIHASFDTLKVIVTERKTGRNSLALSGSYINWYSQVIIGQKFRRLGRHQQQRYRKTRSVIWHAILNFDISRIMFNAIGNLGLQTRGTNVNWCLRIRTTTWNVWGNGSTFPRNINLGIRWKWKLWCQWIRRFTRVYLDLVFWNEHSRVCRWVMEDRYSSRKQSPPSPLLLNTNSQHRRFFNLSQYFQLMYVIK